MDHERFPIIIQLLYRLVGELEKMFPGRHFTLDGHLVGSIGEALAAYYYGLELLTASTKGRDAKWGEQFVEIKATQRDTVGFRCEPDFVLVLQIDDNGSFKEINNGRGHRIWDCLKDKPRPSNGQYQISLNRLRRMMEEVPESERIPRVQP